MKLKNSGYVEVFLAAFICSAVAIIFALFVFLPALIGRGGDSDDAMVKREEVTLEMERLKTQEAQTMALIEQNKMLMDRATKTIVQAPPQDNTKEVIAALAPLLQVKQNESNSTAWALAIVFCVLVIALAAVATAFLLSRRGIDGASYSHAPVEHTVRLSLDRGDNIPVQSRALTIRNGGDVALQEGRGWRL